MNACELYTFLQFLGGMRPLVLRDHDNGRIKVFRGGVWIATIIPGSVMGYVEYSAVLLSKDLEDDFECEWRGSYCDIAVGLSVLQQTGSWDKADEAFYGARELTEQLFG